MARLPTPGGDNGNWGDILNEYLSQSHKSDGSLADNAVNTTQIQDGAVTTAKLHSSVQTALDAASDSITEILQDKQWVVTGPINVAAGEVDLIAPAYIVVPAGYEAVITGLFARINSGTSVQMHVTLNGATISAFGSFAVTTSGTSQTGQSIAASNGALVAPVVDSTSGSPENMTFVVTYKLTKA